MLYKLTFRRDPIKRTKSFFDNVALYLLMFVLFLALTGCAVFKGIAERFSEEKTVKEEIIENAESCVELNVRGPKFGNKVCIDNSHVTLLKETHLLRYERDVWEEFLGEHIKNWVESLKLNVAKDSEVVVYVVNPSSFTNDPYLLIDVENPAWLIRFSVPFNPESWNSEKIDEFFLDRAFVRPRPFAGGIVVQWKNKNALRKIESIIDLYPEAKVINKQGLTWHLKASITEWQNFARAFINSPYIKENMKSWKVIPYSKPTNQPKQLVAFSYQGLLK